MFIFQVGNLQTRQTLSNPCQGCGFFQGCDLPTHTPTHDYPYLWPSQVLKPMTIPTKNMQKWLEKCHICLQAWAMEIATPSDDVGPSEHSVWKSGLVQSFDPKRGGLRPRPVFQIWITSHWKPESVEWKAAADKVVKRWYQSCIDNLEGLVVAWLFELMKMNMSQTGLPFPLHHFLLYLNHY